MTGEQARLARRWLAATAVLLVGVVVLDLARPLPVGWFTPREHVRVVDRVGVVLAERPVPDRGHELWVDLAQVSPAVVDALIASEDTRFFEHAGLDPRGIVRAAVANARAGAVVQGGSTLSQQTVRLLAGRRRGAGGKLAEAWGALKLELHATKSEILTWYLNRAYFGAGAYGIEAAARDTFDESAASLSVSEAATLIGALPAPSRRHPGVDPEAARAARDRVIERMVAVGRLSRHDAGLARAEPLQVRARRAEGLAPHLVARVLAERPASPTVRTTLDAGLQRDVEELVALRLAPLAGREVDHAAVLVIHVPTAEVRAYVGSRSFDAPDGQVDGVRARRSPGSALKPFLYGLAFSAGWRPSDVIDDAPRHYTTRHGAWAPVNYDRSFRGPVRLREALAGSYNVPAVVLLDDVGVSTLQSRLAAVGIDLPKPAAHYGLGLALGDGEVTLEALTAAYAGLARGGVWRPAAVQAVTATASPGVRFLDPRSAFLVGDILADDVARVPGFGRRTPLARPYPASVKTGTSTDYRDNWAVGFTSEWAVGVWVGNFDGRPMGAVSGVTGAGPLWAAVMDRVTGGRAERPEPPAGLVRQVTCVQSGGAASPTCPHTTQDWAPAEQPARAPCALHGAVVSAGYPAAIAYPAPDTVLYIDPRLPASSQRVPLRAHVPPGTASTAWFVDGEPVGHVTAGHDALWAPPHAGHFRVALRVDGRPAGQVQIEVTGAQ